MDITQSQQVRESVIEYWGRFASKDMEERFRGEHLVEDSKTVKFLALMYAVTVVVSLFMDWGLKGVTPTFLILLVPRSVKVLSTAALVLRLRYAITPSLFDHWLLGWFSVNLVMELWVHSTRPAFEAALTSLLFVWALTLLFPLKFSHQAWTATVTTLAFTSLIISQKPRLALLAPILLALMLALAIGLVCSRRSHRTRRESFAAHLVERETGVLLELALAQIKTLEAILSICAACKKIREKDGAWVELDVYVSEHTDTRFSHGMCPDCMARLYPDYSPQKVKS
ncbi:MAG TPA: hypothetical protein VEI73_06720 [Candidatus Acidoferrum sp.]|nr:hypothetical protein [Candidatus Acidoferrum sp.]